MRRWISCFLSACSLAADPPPWLDPVVSAAMKELHVPGAAVGILHDGKLETKGYGLRDTVRNLPVTPDTVFAVGSVTKSFTALGCASVVDEKKLDWDRPVREYLPWFRLHDPVASELITVRDMLTHRSGLPRHDFLRMAVPLERAEFMRRLRYLAPSKSFRETFQYNNLMYVAAGYTCAERAGLSWENLIRSRIFQPVGMTNSTVAVADSQKLADFAKPHLLEGGSARETAFYDYQRFGIGPNGAVNSSANDLLRYLRMVLDDGKVDGRAVILPEQMREIRRPVTVSGDGAYALGWTVDHYRGHLRIQHGGAITGFTAQATLFPEKRIAIIVLNNLGSALPALVANSISDRLLHLDPIDHLDRLRKARASNAPRRPPQPVAGTKPSLDLSAYAGRYFHPAYGAVEVTRAGDGLKAAFPALTLSLRHFHYDVFEAPGTGGLAQFRLDGGGRAATLLLPLEQAVPPLPFERIDSLP